jgi:hypothetical protein
MVDEAFKILTYNQALELVKPKLVAFKEQRSLKSFCDKYDIPYQVVVMMTWPNTNKEFPDVLYKLLEVFGYKAEREKAFKVYNV